MQVDERLLERNRHHQLPRRQCSGAGIAGAIDTWSAVDYRDAVV
jgi:hypothetical protein